MKTILFLHGFFASGSCVPANALKEAFEPMEQREQSGVNSDYAELRQRKATANGRIRVLTPDLPMHPKEALEFIHQLCDKEKPDLLVGNSNGSFLAQIIAPMVGVPALLGNPHFEMTEFLKNRIGEHQYKAPRMDGKQDFIIDEELIKEFGEVQQEQFNYSNPYWKDKIWGIFGEQDTLAQYKPLFLEHYNNAFNFPGGHTPTAEEVKTWYVPLIEKMLITYERPTERYFQHFKGEQGNSLGVTKCHSVPQRGEHSALCDGGGKYRFVRTAFDSETKERMVTLSGTLWRTELLGTSRKDVF